MRAVRIANVALANTKSQSFQIPEGTVAIRIQCRTAADVRIGLTDEDVQADSNRYWTLKSGNVMSQDELPFALGEAETIFFGNHSGGAVVVEIFMWVQEFSAPLEQAA